MMVNARTGRNGAGTRTARWVLGIALVAVAGLGTIAIGQADSVLLSVQLPDRPTAGARLFAQKTCIRCHSLGSELQRVGPDLGRVLFTGNVLDLAGAFWNHSPVMREKMVDLKIQPPTIDSQEMANLVAFLTAYRYYVTEVGETGEAASGEELFATKGCAECHDSTDDTFARLGPNLQRYRGRFSAIFLAQAMWNHGAEMADAMQSSGLPWPQFSGPEMGDLVAYLQAGSAAESTEPVYFEPGSPRRGQELFRDKGCDTCHAIAGEGGSGGPDLGMRGNELVRSVSEVAGLMWNHSQGMTAEFRRRGIERATFSGQEMADIIAYLYFINYANVQGFPDRGEKLFTAKCSVCHSTTAGQQIGTDLTTAPGLDEPIAIIAAMWNHSPGMADELQKMNLTWPRLEPGEAADIVAFITSRRAPR